ncbi:MAG TPA: hypothetical protein DD621_01265 [Clostridiales bacterium]|nr:hypothetical protein [Clostridiales bacterium]
MQFASMSLGIFDFLIDWLTKFLIWLIGWVFDLINKLLATTFYKIGTMILTIADNIQVVFKKLCGMDVYWVVEDGVTTKVEGVDPLAQLFTNSQVMQALIALTLVAIAMVIIATIVQIIRTEFTTEGSKNTKGNIIGQSLKAMLLFLVVPLCCIGGVFICNRLLVAVDRATNLSKGNSTIGSTVFMGAASNANWVRNGSNLTPTLLKGVGFSGTVDQNNRERVAQMVDSAFRDNTLGTSTGFGEVLRDVGQALGQYSYEQIAIVECYYDIYNINYITYIGGALLATYTLLCVCFGMVMRLYKGVVLFIISPPVVGLMPIDNGSAFKDWRKSFLKEILSAYGSVVGMNLLFLILPIISNIKLFTPLKVGAQDFNGLNSFMQVIFTLTGLFMLKDISGMIAGIIGGGDAASAGEGKMKQIGAGIKKVGGMAAGLAMGGAGLAARGMAGIKGMKLKKNATSLAQQLETFDPTEYKDEDEANKAKQKMRQDLIDTQGKIEKNNNLRDFGRKYSTDKLSSKLVGAAGLSGYVKTGADRRNAAADKEKKEEEARKARKEAGRQTTDDIALENALDDKKSREYKHKNKYGAYGINKTLDNTEGAQALNAGAKNMTADYAKLADALSKIGGIKTSLETGDSIGASDQISEMLNALNAIADKTEDQKDLIQKLTNYQAQINSAAGNTKAIKGMANNEVFTAMQDTAGKVKNEASGIVKVVNDNQVNISANTGLNPENQLKSMAEQIVTKMAGNEGKTVAELRTEIDKMTHNLAAAQKKEIEKIKEKIGK